MKTHNVQQGSPEWLELRQNYFTASEAPAMMGASKYQKREALLRLKKTGEAPPVSDHQQAIFDKGHQAEELARPLVEKMINDDLSPTVATVEIMGVPLLASFDGINFDGDTIFENKLWNESLAERVQEQDLEPHYLWQIGQQLIVSGAEVCFFVCSDGTQDKFEMMQVDETYLNMKLGKDWQAQLIHGWENFIEELANYEPTEIEVQADETIVDKYHRMMDLKAQAALLESEIKEAYQAAGADKMVSDEFTVYRTTGSTRTNFNKLVKEHPEVIEGIDIEQYVTTSKPSVSIRAKKGKAA